MKSFINGTGRAKQWQLNNDIKTSFGHALFSSNLQKLISKALESDSFRQNKFQDTSKQWTLHIIQHIQGEARIRCLHVNVQAEQFLGKHDPYKNGVKNSSQFLGLGVKVSKGRMFQTTSKFKKEYMYSTAAKKDFA